MKRVQCLMLLFVIISLSGCSVDTSPNSAAGTRTRYQNYKEIPGVTREEIEALDKLLAEKPRLAYGISVSTEAFIQSDGNVGGFASLFCRRLTELFGFEFDFIPCSWEEMNEKIVSKEIDLVSDFTATPERLQKFLMTDTIIQRTIKIFTDINSDSLSVTAKSRAIRCAFMEGSTTYSHVAETWKLPFTPIFIPDQSVVPEMLLSGEIDAFIEEGTLEAAFDEFGFIREEEFYPLTYSPISLTSGNPEMAPVIDVMQKYLKNGGFYELTELYNQGYKNYLRHKLSKQLTNEEKAYITRHLTKGTVILAACEVDNYPTSFYNSKENNFQGMALDTLNQISDLTGLTFQVGNTPDAPWSELIDGLENGRYSIISELLWSNQREGRFIWADKPYCTNSYAMLSKVEYPDIDINQILFSKVGLMEGSAHTDVFLEWFPDSTNTAMYKSNIDAFLALEKGDIDLLMASQNMLLNMTNYQEKPGFKANIIFKYSSDSFFGFNKNEELLRSIVSKALPYANTEEITARWQRKVFDYQSKMTRDMIPYLIVFAVSLLIGIFVILLLFLKNRKISKNLEELVAKRTNELALQTSTLTTVFESIPDLVFCKDLNMNFTRCNRSFEKHFGRSAEDIIGKGDTNGLGIPAEVATQFREVDVVVIEERRPVTVEEIIPAADGSNLLFETVKTPLMQDGNVIGIVGISRDITQRKAGEENLKLTLDNLNTCIYISEIETGEILFMNEQMATEFNCKGFNGKICWKVLQNNSDKRCDFCPISKLLESGDKYYVWENQSPVTGRHYKIIGSLIKWYDGRLVHLQHLVDITDSVKLQQDLEKASRAKGDFLSRMSHEIRTPLNAIIGMTSIAKNTDDRAKIKDCLDKADNASKHLLGIINDILDMSKIEADKFEISFDEFDFEKALMSITNVINFRAEEKRQNLVVNMGEGVPSFIYGDKMRLSQVITNLLSNAVKFTPEDGTIILCAEKIDETEEDVTLRIEVADNGIGISEEQQKRLFTSFEQADGSISRKFGGTGLGLAISKRIIELMGGTIWIESEIDKGSKFIFTIKVKRGRKKPHTLLSSKINRHNIRILAVDDSEETRMCFSNIMKAHGLPYDVAENGEEALEKVSQSGQRPFNIFFIDWQMPGMDGIELTKRIKEVTGDNSVVFMISVTDWNDIESDAISVGVKRFVPKPLFPSSLIDAVNECLGVETQKAEIRESGSTNNLNFNGKTILIAEDVEINQEIMSAILEETNINIDFAGNGRNAVSMFAKNPDKYSIILMDIHMPEMDGYEATRTIRALDLEQAGRIPIIAMTANVFREDIENCFAAGMNGHIGKPIEPEGLFAKLIQYLI